MRESVYALASLPNTSPLWGILIRNNEPHPVELDFYQLTVTNGIQPNQATRISFADGHHIPAGEAEIFEIDGGPVTDMQKALKEVNPDTDMEIRAVVGLVGGDLVRSEHAVNILAHE
jgi:hypothetical protein